MMMLLSCWVMIGAPFDRSTLMHTKCAITRPIACIEDMGFVRRQQSKGKSNTLHSLTKFKLQKQPTNMHTLAGSFNSSRKLLTIIWLSWS